MSRKLKWFVTVVFFVCLSGSIHAQSRLVGLTGNQEDDDQESFPDVTLFEINTADASTTQLMPLTFIPDTDAIGFNPVDGLLYHTGGSEAWTDDPSREGGFRDHQYFEAVNLDTGEFTPIFNANPPPSPDDFPSFGLEAPRPPFVLPEKVRLIDDPECEDQAVPGICPREDGENEYHALRSLTWSQDKQLFYGSDEKGIYTLTTDGDAEFVGQPFFEKAGDTKAMTFYESGGETVLLAGTKRDGRLYRLDPETGEDVDDPVELQIPEDSPFDVAFDGLLAMAQDPGSGLLYGIRRTDPDTGNAFERELIIINPESGETQLIGDLGLHFASLAFVTASTPGDFDNNGILDVADANLLVWEVADGMNDPKFDLNGDDLVDDADINIWIKDLANSWFGDADVNGLFDTSDLVTVFAAGKYEMDLEANWSEGDWTGDHRFDTSDLVKAFADGGYEQGGRDDVQAVPEPSSVVLLMLSVNALLHLNRRSRRLAGRRVT